MSQLYAVAFPESNSAAPSCDCLAHVYGNAADHGERVRRYASDMTDAEWAVVRAGMPVPGWLEGRGGQPKSYCHRQMIDAVRYLVDNGIKWRAMPSDFPVGLVTGCRFGFVRGGCRRGLARSSRCAAKWPELPSAAGIKSVAPSRYEIYSELFASKVTMNPGHPVGDVLAFGAVFAAQTRT